jgi:hypothetical protein
VDGEGPASLFDVAEDIDALLIPAKLPGEYCAEEDYKEAVGDVGYRRIARLEALFELPVLGQS